MVRFQSSGDGAFFKKKMDGRKKPLEMGTISSEIKRCVARVLSYVVNAQPIDSEEGESKRDREEDTSFPRSLV